MVFAGDTGTNKILTLQEIPAVGLPQVHPEELNIRKPREEITWNGWSYWIQDAWLYFGRTWKGVKV